MPSSQIYFLNPIISLGFHRKKQTASMPGPCIISIMLENTCVNIAWLASISYAIRLRDYTYTPVQNGLMLLVYHALHSVLCTAYGIVQEPWKGDYLARTLLW